ALPRTVRSVVAAPGGGRALDAGLRARIEPHVGADLSHVRVRRDPDAAAAARDLGARAFTSGSTIFLAAESSPADVGLIAHEAAHVAQQQSVAAARTTLMRAVTDYLPDVSVTDVIPDWILDGVRSAVRAIPGYTLLTYVVGSDPLTDEPVTVTPVDMIETLLTYGPFGPAVGPVLQTIEVLGDIFTFVRESLVANNLTLDRISRDVDAAWDELSVTNGVAGNVAIVRRYVDAFLRDVGAFVDTIVDRVIEIVRSVVADVAEPLLEAPEIAPVWNLAKKVIHYDPLRGTDVDAPTAEIIADFLRLIGEEQRLAQMEERGTLQETADWLDTQLATFASLVGELGTLFSDAWEAIQPQNLPDLLTNLEDLARRAFGFVGRVADFAATVILQILEIIKDALLGWLSEHAHTIPGFHLLTVILERNPFTDEAVPRTAENLIKGFITLLPGGEETYNQLAESGVIADAAGRIEGEMTRLGISWDMVTGLFLGIWDTLTLDDLLDPIGAFEEILALFGEPLSRLVEFVGVVIEVVITLVLRLMNFPSDLLGSIISNTVQAIEDIKRDPVAFIKNMLAAVKLGFTGFFDNIATYLIRGLQAWLFRGLGQLGITIPSEITVQSIVTLVLQVLGLSIDALWTKLGQHIGQERVAMIRGAIDRLAGAWEFIKDVQENGISAVWRYVREQLSNLWDTLLDMAKEWIVSTIITRVTAKLLSMLDPTGIMAVVNSFIAFFNAVQSAIEYLRDILEIINRYTATLAAIAGGNIVPGAQMLEQGLAAAIPVAIGFLANQVGLGNVPEKVVELIGRLRELVDRALDWLVAQAVRLGRAALNALGVGRPEEPTPVDPTDHDAVATQVVRELEETPSAPDDYATLRTQKEAQARTIEDRYRGTLGPNIGLTIHFAPASDDAADNDLDFEVVIAPNTKRKSGQSRTRANVRIEGGVLVINESKRFSIGARIQLARGGGWHRETRVIKAIETRSAAGGTFIFLDIDTDPPGDRASVTATSYPTQWREPIEALEGLSDERLAEENAKESWPERQTALWVLNYRAHAVQHVNPGGKDWEHIVEAETGGAHSTDNMALTDSEINNRLAAYYNTYRRYPELALEDIVDPIKLRDYMRGKSASVQRRWKLRVYALPEFGVSVSSQNAGRGRYQVLQ
nr:DUF4157 domain-containing protein [Actinomycetota bacterium]